ncbi:ribonuclease H-like domain-containing protein [Tanacetum coccineum]|uniref:Ribonuclease H-like domain-containing protein n=1 Tax=Tanacetum coccineum TaxID=301880 RepID=A0ABQ5C3X3_9ASTR
MVGSGSSSGGVLFPPRYRSHSRLGLKSRVQNPLVDATRRLLPWFYWLNPNYLSARRGPFWFGFKCVGCATHGFGSLVLDRWADGWGYLNPVVVPQTLVRMEGARWRGSMKGRLLGWRKLCVGIGRGAGNWAKGRRIYLYLETFTAQSQFYGGSTAAKGSFPGSVHLGQSPSMPFHPSQLFASGSQGSGQATLLPNAFNTTTLQEPASGNWNMDTGASSHLNDSVHCLSDILNMCIYPSVAVGDGRFIPVTNSGHSVLSTPFRPLRLNNVLITPNIVKNLIFVRQFVRDNSCTVEFDPFGFSVKDFITRRYTWHQRLGHPGSEVLRRLVSSDSISCNKEKLPVLCHACQLGKHVKLPFVSSSSSVTSCFDIVHSDLWTSPNSESFWFPVLCFVSRSLFSCDHGGEFDNHAFHKLFNDNGILNFLALAPHNKNGKSERMIRTINNLIRTLLFQAHLPPNYWTEALNMAVYLLNILPSRAINNEIPFTRLFGAQPDYSVLRVFGCLCYPHIDTNHKLGPRATLPFILGHAASFGLFPLALILTPIKLSFPVIRSLAGSLQYLTFTRPDITYAVQQVCLYMPDPREPHFSTLKRIFWYVQGTLDYGLQLFSSTTDSLIAYSDADWAGCPTTRQSTSGYCVFLDNNLLSWSSKHQQTLSRSNAEAEYRGVANAVAKTCWIRNLHRELHTPLSSATIVYCDNVSAVYLSSNPVQHQRTKHIKIDIHFVWDLVATGQVRVLYVPSRFQYADIITKGLPSTLFDEFRDSLSVRCTPAPTVGEC